MNEISNVSNEELSEATPMMQQYFAAKKAHPGILVFFRMGDFYELFFEDAKIVASELNLVLTTRGKHLGEDIPMSGVPVSSVDYYLGKLVKLGYKIAICEQLESPEEAKKRGYKAIVKRGITRIVTPGTVTEESLLDAKEGNFLMSIAPNMKKGCEPDTISFAVADVSTDKLFVHTVTASDFLNSLEQYAPQEVLCPAAIEGCNWFKTIKNYVTGHITILSDSKFNPITETDRVKNYYQVSALDGFGLTSNYEISACGAIIEYISVTQCTNAQKLSKPIKINQSKFMIVDSATHRNLEIVRSNNDNKHSLLRHIDNTCTAFGARMLMARLVTPIIDIQEINDRLDSVEFFVNNIDIKKKLITVMKTCPDIERIIVRMRFNRYSMRDLSAIRQCIIVVESIKDIFINLNIKIENKFCASELPDLSMLLSKLQSALVDDVPATYKAGDVIKRGYSQKLDEIRFLVEDGHSLIADLQAKYISKYAINTLKIKNNNILGWYIEIPLSQKSKVDNFLIHKQTLVNNVRYVSDELNELQTRLEQASTDLVRVENEIITELVNLITDRMDDFADIANFIARLDIAISMASLATNFHYCRPQLTTDKILSIKSGRHPVLESLVDEFVPNDCDLYDPGRLSILTGPNMAGKSTYLRQNALIVLMAHIGSFVPAHSAIIGITDRLFSRIGASDDLAKGRSTFMVEMIETASILNQATDRSFVILDEVGRGTSTYDGISIAWSVVEYLYNTNRCRTIFATHYLELLGIKKDISELKCQTLKVNECKGRVMFYHSIIDGVADKAYGVYVAKLAGLPKSVIQKANRLLAKLENGPLNQKKYISRQLSMFSDNTEDDNSMLSAHNSDTKNDVIASITSLDLNEMTPKKALDLLYDLKRKLVD